MHPLTNSIRTFNRFELKYILPLQQVAKIKSALSAYLNPDDYGNQSGRYAITSLYYDSPALRCYQEKLDGIKFRRKLRIRRYENEAAFTEESPVFVEIKQRVDRVTQKRRILLPYAEALSLCNDREMPACPSEDTATAEEIYVFLWQYNLQPSSLVRYEREAWVGTEYDPGLRVTFDTELTFQSNNLHIHDQFDGLPMLPAHLVVMEIKVNERIPYWLTDLIAVHNLQITRISKYCCSVEAVQNMPVVSWRSPLPESARDVLSTAFSIFNPLKQKLDVSR
ncbi:MAG: polyphosphate polymerase domain-containing protein [Anaerolineales bacterium]